VNARRKSILRNIATRRCAIIIAADVDP